MFRKTLIPLDGSELSEQVLDAVTRLIARQDVGVTSLLRVVESEDEKAAAEEYLASLRKRLSERSIPASVNVAVGDPAEEILTYVKHEGHDLIAMATHGRSGVTRWVRGSVAERILRSTAVPLLLVTPRTEEQEPEEFFRRILVPHDGSTLADQVLPHVKEIASLYGSQVILLRVESLAFADPEGRIVSRTPEQVLGALEQTAARWREAGLEVELKGELGEPASRIIELVDKKDVDLVVISTHGRSGFNRWWFGSVAEAVLRRCHAPLLVQRAAGESPV